MPVQTPPLHSSTPQVSIIIVTYNAVDYVRRCLDSIRQHTSTPHEIIVLDNASREETRSYLREQTDIRLFLNEDNRLWCAGCNQGMQEADPASPYLLMLNPDVEVLRDDWLQVLIDVMELDPAVGIVGTKHHYRKAGPIYGWIDGQCMMFRRKMVEQMGYMDCARFPMGGGPQLYTIRAFKEGWRYKTVHPHDHLISHHGKKSRAELKGKKAWTAVRPDFVALMREEGLEPQGQSGLRAFLEARVYALRRERFFYAPPSRALQASSRTP